MHAVPVSYGNIVNKQSRSVRSGRVSVTPASSVEDLCTAYEAAKFKLGDQSVIIGHSKELRHESFD